MVVSMLCSLLDTLQKMGRPRFRKPLRTASPTPNSGAGHKVAETWSKCTIIFARIIEYSSIQYKAAILQLMELIALLIILLAPYLFLRSVVNHIFTGKFTPFENSEEIPEGDDGCFIECDSEETRQQLKQMVDNGQIKSVTTL